MSKTPNYVQIEIDERTTKGAVKVRFSAHHNRKHEYAIHWYDEDKGITTIILKKLVRKQ